MAFKITRKVGIFMMILGAAFQILNILTYGYLGIDIDIIGALIFIVGLAITIVRWRKKNSFLKPKALNIFQL